MSWLMRTGIALGMLLLSVFNGYAEDSITVYKLLQRLEHIQLARDSAFPPGSFPSYRKYSTRDDVYKKDDNAFFTALIAFTLKQHQSIYTPAEKLLADRIINRTKEYYQLFRNTTGRHTYNFWRTNPPVVFPNGDWLNWMNKTHKLPDDIDDTVMILMATDTDEHVAKSVHALMAQYANTKKRTSKSSYKKYRRMPVYSTWFGEKMPVDIDVCVLSNALNFVHQFHLKYTQSDSATVKLLGDVMAHKHYLTNPAFISPHYARTPIILYHFARMIQQGKIHEFDQYKPQLIADAQDCYRKADNFLDQVLLSSALYMLGSKPGTMMLQTDATFDVLLEKNDFVFFVANMSAIMPAKMRQLMTSAKLGTFYYYCPAYNNVLLLENLLLARGTM